MTAVGLTVLAAPPAPAARRVTPEQFLISFWCAPPPEETTLAWYQEIAGTGFNAILPPCGGAVTPALNRKILELCGQTGLKAIVSDPRLEQVGAAGAADAGLDAAVGDDAKSSALLGYFL